MRLIMTVVNTDAHSKGSFRIRGRQFYLCVYENEEEDARDENEK